MYTTRVKHLRGLGSMPAMTFHVNTRPVAVVAVVKVGRVAVRVHRAVVRVVN